MGFYSVNPNKTAILFFDMLKAYYTDLDDAAKARTAPVVANCSLLNSVARTAGIPVVYTQADHRADGLDSAGRYTDTNNGLQPWDDPELRNRPVRMVVGGTWTTEVIDELTPQPGDYVVLKHRWSAFHQTHLELSLRTRGIDTIILCGGSTDVGVASTAFAARDLDFDLVIVKDACTSAKVDNHEQFVNRFAPFMARSRVTSEVVAMIEAGVEERETARLA